MGENLRQIIRAALAGWAGMTGLITAARLVGLGWTDIIGIEGAFFAEPNSKRARTIGGVIHFGMCLWIAGAYLLGFRATGLRPSWQTGALGGLIHALLGGLVAAFVTTNHPRRADLEMPGFAGSALGLRTLAGWLASHLLFGSLVGRQYGRDHGA